MAQRVRGVTGVGGLLRLLRCSGGKWGQEERGTGDGGKGRYLVLWCAGIIWNELHPLPLSPSSVL